jgi:uncharacterized protein (DUF1778 family)
MTRLHIKLPDDLHRRLKSAAALEGKTMTTFVIDALRTAVSASEAAR